MAQRHAWTASQIACRAAWPAGSQAAVACLPRQTGPAGSRHRTPQHARTPRYLTYHTKPRRTADISPARAPRTAQSATVGCAGRPGAARPGRRPPSARESRRNADWLAPTGAARYALSMEISPNWEISCVSGFKSPSDTVIPHILRFPGMADRHPGACLRKRRASRVSFTSSFQVPGFRASASSRSG